MGDKSDTKNLKDKMNISINLDTTPILYTDNINISANKDGVVLNVMQIIPTTKHRRIVSRIGMSREHAKNLIEKLGQLLLKTEGEVISGKKILN